MNSRVLITKNIRTKSLAILGTILAAVVLPQLLHAIGIVSGTGAMLGSSFLPMHLPIIAAGIIAGPIVGLAAGLISPILSFYLTGMPTGVLLPFMVIELGAYGLCAGLVKNTNMPMLIKVLVTQVSGRVIRAIAILSAFYLFGFHAINPSIIYTSILAGLPGLIIQWSIIPLFMFWLDKKE